jgi:hypothetical protein
VKRKRIAERFICFNLCILLLVKFSTIIWIFFADLGTPTEKCRARETACSGSTFSAEYGKIQILLPPELVWESSIILVYTQSVGLKTLPPSVSRLSRQCGILNISQPYRPWQTVTGIALLYGDGVCFLWGRNWTATSSQYLAVNCEPIVWVMLHP